MTQTENNPPLSEGPAAADIEQECELWDWARAAGASAQDLRNALLKLLGSAKTAY